MYARSPTSQLTILRARLDLQSQSAIFLLMAQPSLLENLRKAHQGNYSVILSLLGCLDQGLQSKRLVDRVIDTCAYLHFILNRRRLYRLFHCAGDHVSNLREDVLIHRIRYSLTTADQDEGMREALLDKASRSLEQ